MSVTREAARRRLEDKYQDGALSRSLIELIIKLEGRQYFLEEVEESKGIRRAFSVSINISITQYEAGDISSESDMKEMFADVPPEYKVDVLYLGDITAYSSGVMAPNHPEDMKTKRELDWEWKGELLIGFDGSIWVWSENGMYLAARSFREFMLISPKVHYGQRYPLKF